MAKRPSRATVLGLGVVLGVAVIGGGIGAVIATGGSHGAPAPVRLVQRASTASPTTTTTAPTATTTAPAPATTTTTAPAATGGTGGGSVGSTGPSQPASGTTATTTTTTTAPTVTVPNVVGDTVTAAEAALTALGLVPIKQTQPGCTAGVVGMTTAAGTSVAPGSTVYFRVDDPSGMDATGTTVCGLGR